jgi:hypothetical protein
MPAIQFIQMVTGGIEPSVSTETRNLPVRWSQRSELFSDA